MKSYIFWLLLLITATLNAQENKKKLQIILPTTSAWNVVSEGNRLSFLLKTTAESSSYSIVQGQLEDMSIDSTGEFVWEPGYDIADRLTKQKTVQVLIEARANGEIATQAIDLVVNHVNRIPKVEPQAVFYLKYQTNNVYKIDQKLVKDDDGDPVVIIPVLETMPEGAKLTAQGELSWEPTKAQFLSLKNKPIFIDFLVEDQPSKARAKGRIKVEPTQLDLPPSITYVPMRQKFKLKEDATINLKFFLADPNGDDDIEAFDFVSQNPLIPSTALVKNTHNQYEFIWNPSYSFVKDPADSMVVELSFFVIDKTQKRDEIKVSIVVLNTINEVENDKYLYDQYRSALVEAWNLLEQLSEKEQSLKKSYLTAKKGKRHRSMVTASLGAVTGLTPALTKTTEIRSIVSAVGGTTIMTLGALEAAEVVGRSLKDLLERYNYVLEKKTEIQSKGDIFAREFALKSSRRSKEFLKKRDEFKFALILKGPVTLDLDAGWENKKEATDKAISRSFKDFMNMNE